MVDMRAYRFDGKGTAEQIELPGGVADAPEKGFAWVHMLGSNDEVLPWLQKAGLDPLEIEALTADETRPRCTIHENVALMNLRGVNLSPGAEPEDMVSIRFYLSQHFVISVQRRRLYAVHDLFAEIESGSAAESPGELAARIALRLADRAEPVVSSLNERVDELETQALDDQDVPDRSELADVRRMAIVLRRYMAPQRDALTTLEIENYGWLHGKGGRARVREAAERMTRLAEELDALRDRAQVVRDQIADIRAEAMNRQMLILSVVAALFLPLGLITGLLGINVGGVPGANAPWAFWAVCGVLVLLVGGQFWFFRKIGMIGK